MHDRAATVNAVRVDTKAAAHYTLDIAAGASATTGVCLTDSTSSSGVAGAEFDKVFAERNAEAGEFYATVIPQDLSPDTQS